MYYTTARRRQEFVVKEKKRRNAKKRNFKFKIFHRKNDLAVRFIGSMRRFSLPSMYIIPCAQKKT